jgi:ATP-dependent DNA helicase RecG
VNLRELQTIVSGGESEKVEFKRSTGQRTDACKAVCALANGVGGFVFFGITDKGEIIGQQVSAHTRKKSPMNCVASSRQCCPTSKRLT